MRLKKVSSGVLLFFSFLAIGQDSLVLSQIDCSLKLKQIKSHLNKQYVVLSQGDSLYILDSLFRISGQSGISVAKANLASGQALQYVVLDDSQNLLYLDQYLNTNYSIPFPVEQYSFMQILPSTHNNIWLYDEIAQRLVLYDPFYKQELKSVPLNHNEEYHTLTGDNGHVFLISDNGLTHYDGQYVSQEKGVYKTATLYKGKVYYIQNNKVLIQSGGKRKEFNSSVFIQYIYPLSSEKSLLIDTEGQLFLASFF